MAAAGKGEQVEAHLGEVKQTDAIHRATGIDTTGFGISLTNEAVTHSLRRHGNDPGELKLRPDDFRHVATVLNEGRVERGHDSEQGVPRVHARKVIDGVRYHVIAEVSRRKKKLRSITLHKSLAARHAG